MAANFFQAENEIMNLLKLFALIAGALLPLQAGINTQLKNYLGNASLASLVSFVAGAVSLLLYVGLLRPSLPSAGALGRVPWWAWVGGGVCGAIYVVLVILTVQRLGAAIGFSLIIAGQMVMSAVLDQFGWVGFQPHAMSLGRGIGLALVVLGVVLIRKF
ncbi:MAG: uncharacterized protein JWR69_1180 [Pedosphaera sp.]|nr:uncharacterized protein [Pedosphaera sp.]